jgi:hypothetical protein
MPIFFRDDVSSARHLAGCREGILPSRVGAERPHDSRRDVGATFLQFLTPARKPPDNPRRAGFHCKQAFFLFRRSAAVVP